MNRVTIFASAALLILSGAGLPASAAAAEESEPEAAAPESKADESSSAPAFTRIPAPDGIQIRRFNKTDGAQPGRTDRVTVHYHGTFEDGRVFDSSVERGQPATFPLNRVIKCWTVAVTKLHVGEKVEVICPPETAYGARGSPPSIPPNATLKFEIELLGIQ